MLTRQPIRGAGSGVLWDEGFRPGTRPEATHRTGEKMPDGVEWSEVTVTTDLLAESRTLARLSADFEEHLSAWAHPAARAELRRLADALHEHAEEAALMADDPDYWARLDALRIAMARRYAGQMKMRQWFDRSQMFNENRIRPEPQSIGPEWRFQK